MSVRAPDICDADELVARAAAMRDTLPAMLLFVVPQFKNIYAGLGGSLPLPTRMLIGIYDVFKK